MPLVQKRVSLQLPKNTPARRTRLTLTSDFGQRRERNFILYHSEISQITTGLRQRNSLIYKWILVMLWCGVIFTFSSIPDHTGRVLNFENWEDVVYFWQRKGAHMVEYAILAILTWRALFTTWPKWKKWHSGITFIFVLLYAISDEWHQTFVFGRSGTVRDVLFDCMGAFLALVLLHYLERI